MENLVKTFSIKWNWKSPENIYFVLALIFGILFVFITPPFQVPDEDAHFIRANQIANGKLFGVEGEVISSVYDFVITIDHFDLPHNPQNKIRIDSLVAELFRPLNKDAKISVSSFTTHNNSFVNYIPQAIGIFIGKAINFSPFKILFFSRLVNLFVAIILTTLAIKISPFRKWSILYVGFLPMALYEYASVSPDALVISICILYLTLVMNLNKQNQIKTNKVLAVILLTISLALIKPGYVFLSLLIFLVPIHNTNKKLDLLIKIFVIFVTFTLFYLQLIITVSNPQGLPQVKPGIDAAAQLQFVLNEPIKFLLVVAGYLISHFLINFWMFIGVFGWADTILPIYIYIAFSISFLFILLFDNNYPGTLSRWSRILLLSIYGITLIAITSIFYFLWTPMKSNMIIGFQGRYMLPVVGLLFISFQNQRNFLQSTRLYIFLPVWFIGAIISLMTIIQRYYF